jgi:Predicted glycosyltransferases
MNSISIVIPNYNGLVYLENCLDALKKQTKKDFTTIIVDNGSSDGSLEFIREHYQEVEIIELKENTGFCGAVNQGIKATNTPYIILLNNDTIVEKEFVAELFYVMERETDIFSGQAKMLQLHQPTLIDDAGDYYNALGWAFAKGKGKCKDLYNEERPIFSSCAGAAIYRRTILEEIGLFDEKHFAYLEDTDIGYRAKIYGYKNIYIPKAVVYHVGSGTSGSQYNKFKIRYSSRNNIYLIYKNMPTLQIIINIPFFLIGFSIKTLFFIKKGMGKEYLVGMGKGFILSHQSAKVKFRWKNLKNYTKIQIELLVNIFKRLK